ncbi:putative thiol peroxidase [Ktedonospora formicarum]|uniref:Putative thiol peroxidase n=1 Tax=Ktedonospora formicarum TaxID=2778364 RepID=A0A8J3MSV7_9CHLR|nr:putative thiol peroxidase [Ktedonospora formicarum]
MFTLNKSRELEERPAGARSQQEHLTVVGSMLQSAMPVPDFTLDYLDLLDMSVHRTSLSDSAGMVRLLSVINSLEKYTCQQQTLQWERYSQQLPPGACVFTVSMDLPYAQALWQSKHEVIHQMLSAWRCNSFGPAYGIWLKEWHLLQRSVFVIDHRDCVAYADYVVEQTQEPDYEMALAAVNRCVRAQRMAYVKDE